MLHIRWFKAVVMSGSWFLDRWVNQPFLCRCSLFKVAIKVTLRQVK